MGDTVYLMEQGIKVNIVSGTYMVTLGVGEQKEDGHELGTHLSQQEPRSGGL